MNWKLVSPAQLYAITMQIRICTRPGCAREEQVEEDLAAIADERMELRRQREDGVEVLHG